MIDNVLKWDFQLVCKFVWGDWDNSWGVCFKMCGGGEKKRYRKCLGISSVQDCVRDQGGEDYQIVVCEI